MPSFLKLKSVNHRNLDLPEVDAHDRTTRLSQRLRRAIVPPDTRGRDVQLSPSLNGGMSFILMSVRISRAEFYNCPPHRSVRKIREQMVSTLSQPEMYATK
jgi:hypothetical protein